MSYDRLTSENAAVLLVDRSHGLGQDNQELQTPMCYLH